MERVVRKIPKESGLDEFYVLLTEWKCENVSLTVIDKDLTWTGKADSNEILQLCNAVHKTKEEYLVELKYALTQSESGYTYLIDEENFIVKKVAVNSNIKMKFCIIHLQEIPSVPTYTTLLSGLLDQEKSNSSNISKLTQEVQYLKAEREDFIRKLQHLTTEKASLETILYTKFCEILNAKKEKIAYLESQLGAVGDSKSNEQCAESALSTNTDEQDLQGNGAPRKRTALDHCVAKRKCTVVKNSEELYSESGEAISSAFLHDSSAPKIDNQNLNSYDSDTDIDTDDESVSNSAITCHTKTVHSSFDVLDKPTRTLPKRGGSSILPKRANAHVGTNNSNNNNNNNMKFQEKVNDKPSSSTSNKKFDDEFSSQSLLDEY